MYIEFNLIIFIDILTTMSNRIRKQRKPSFILKVIVRSKEISIYKNYFKRGLRFYAVSPLDSVQYIKCVRLNRFGCDVLDSIVIQLEILSSIHVYLETKLKDTFEK